MLLGWNVLNAVESYQCLELRVTMNIEEVNDEYLAFRYHRPLCTVKYFCCKYGKIWYVFLLFLLFLSTLFCRHVN